MYQEISEDYIESGLRVHIRVTTASNDINNRAVIDVSICTYQFGLHTVPDHRAEDVIATEKASITKFLHAVRNAPELPHDYFMSSVLNSYGYTTYNMRGFDDIYYVLVAKNAWSHKPTHELAKLPYADSLSTGENRNIINRLAFNNLFPQETK